MTRTALNNVLWTLSLLLQAGLLVRLVRRGLALRVPTFTVLIGFYVVRSLSLYLLSSHMAPSSYAHTYSLLAILDLFLQLSVAIEIELRLFPIGDLANPGKALRGVGILLAIPALALGATVLITASLPARATQPADLLQLFAALFFLLLGFLATARSASRYLSRVTIGLAAYGALCVAGIIGRTFATVHKSSQSFLVWSYAVSIGWLVIVGVWLFVLPPDPLRRESN